MVTLATYKLEIDWDADDIYDGGTEDVTSDVRNIFWRRGKDHNSQLVGRWVSLDAQVTLKNDSGQYSSYATSNIKPGRKVRLNATDASGEVNLWEGKVENIIPRPSPFGLDVVEIDVIGWLGYIGDTEIDVEMQTSIRTDQAISEVLDAAGLPKLYNNQVLDDSPVGYWRFGEASGDAQDQTANNNDGTVTGVTYGSTTLLIGDTTTSFEFDGVTGNVNLGSPPELDDVFSGGGSVEAWIFADNDGEGGGGRIYDKNDWVLAVIDESAGEMKLNFRHQFSGANAEWATTSRVIGQSTHHVVVVYNRDDVANNPTIYVDGASVAVTETTTPVGVASSDAGSDLYVGNRLADDATFDGHIQ